MNVQYHMVAVHASRKPLRLRNSAYQETDSIVGFCTYRPPHAFVAEITKICLPKTVDLCSACFC